PALEWRHNLQPHVHRSWDVPLLLRSALRPWDGGHDYRSIAALEPHDRTKGERPSQVIRNGDWGIYPDGAFPPHAVRRTQPSLRPSLAVIALTSSIAWRRGRLASIAAP